MYTTKKIIYISFKNKKNNQQLFRYVLIYANNAFPNWNFLPTTFCMLSITKMLLLLFRKHKQE